MVMMTIWIYNATFNTNNFYQRLLLSNWKTFNDTGIKLIQPMKKILKVHIIWHQCLNELIKFLTLENPQRQLNWRHRTPSRNSSGKSDPPLRPPQPKWPANLIALRELRHNIPPGCCQDWHPAASSQCCLQYFSAGSPQPFHAGGT